jgi:hypothetical protein
MYTSSFPQGKGEIDIQRVRNPGELSRRDQDISGIIFVIVVKSIVAVGEVKRIHKLWLERIPGKTAPKLYSPTATTNFPHSNSNFYVQGVLAACVTPATKIYN